MYINVIIRWSKFVKISSCYCTLCVFTIGQYVLPVLPSFGLHWLLVVIMTLHLIHCLTSLIQYSPVFLLFLLASPRLCTWHGRKTGYSLQIITLASEGRIGQPEEGFSKWSTLADEMVSLHRARTHWGLWGVRHIWANRLLMSCLHEPLITALEREMSPPEDFKWLYLGLHCLSWHRILDSSYLSRDVLPLDFYKITHIPWGHFLTIKVIWKCLQLVIAIYTFSE